jgi:hypothetical protein
MQSNMKCMGETGQFILNAYKMPKSQEFMVKICHTRLLIFVYLFLIFVKNISDNLHAAENIVIKIDCSFKKSDHKPENPIPQETSI